MRVDPDGYLHLTYCTNIHAADGWDAVYANVRRFGPALKARFSPDAPFGLGLRLSARDAQELAAGPLGELKRFLGDEGLYVAIINGFPHGSFHRSVVKADVYAPDWRDQARVDYTLTLIDILRELVPADIDAGVSTVPLTYKSWLGDDDEDAWDLMVSNVVTVAERLAAIRQRDGKIIHLDIEPEPDCALENTRDTIAFFERQLVAKGVPRLARSLGVGTGPAERVLRDHVRLCFDCCHFSVEHEDPLAALGEFHRAGIQIGRVQLSSALQVHMPGDVAAGDMVADRLRPFADATYLHQVIAERDGRLQHFPDLDVAIGARASAPGEWHIHFHVPLFTSEYNGLGSSQHDVRAVLLAARAQRFTRHLEIETYTWDVLPGQLKVDLLESIAREYEWVLGHLRPGR